MKSLSCHLEFFCDPLHDPQQFLPLLRLKCEEIFPKSGAFDLVRGVEHICKQCVGVDLQRVGEGNKGLQRGILPAAFNVADVLGRHAQLMRQLRLRHIPALTHLLNSLANLSHIHTRYLFHFNFCSKGGIHMQEKTHKPISPYADLMGRFVGQLRDHERITLKQLSKGLCGPSFLNKIENGNREAGKLLTDAFFQRLGKPVELFERILGHEEFVKWTQRQEIICLLRSGNTQKARECAANYRTDNKCVLDRQFLAIVEINCLALGGMSAQELMELVTAALRMTRPDFGKVPLDKLLLSQNEGRLLFAHLQLREELEGSAAVADDYRALARYFKHPRYESRERVYLFPYVACRVVENDYRDGNYEAALAMCEDAIAELTQEKRLFAYDQLLAWKQKLFDAMGNPDRTPGLLLEELKKILNRAPARAQLLVPCEEQGHVYCLNQVIRGRRALLGFSQEELSDDACGLRSLSRIENEDRKIQRKNRKLLLQKVNMSGERYDYEIISERYEDYLLRSELDRAIAIRDVENAKQYLSILRQRVPKIPANNQYIQKKEVEIKALLPENHPETLTLKEQGEILESVIHQTIPIDIHRIEYLPKGILTINEILALIMTALCYKKQQQHQKSLSILSYTKECIEYATTNVSYYEDVYTRISMHIASALNREEKYREAEILSQECANLAIENLNCCQLARFLCSAAHNIEAQLPNFPEDEQILKKQEAFSLHKQAYVAAEISNDRCGQQHIDDHCKRVYGKRISCDL